MTLQHWKVIGFEEVQYRDEVSRKLIAHYRLSILYTSIASSYYSWMKSHTYLPLGRRGQLPLLLWVFVCPLKKEGMASLPSCYFFILR